MKRFLLVLAGTVAMVFLMLYDVDLFTRHMVDVRGNLEAAVIWGTPTALAFLWRAEHRHRKAEAAAQARHEERIAHLNALGAKVDQLHEHLGVKPPDEA